ncbi:DUF6482 family protein [Litchfieldella xinjiangensis]|uniref:DUF6482 family protein n=1 Tax=Litchfieldella xinjiangensis TaxID=1166948 RepID=UPI0006936AE7|nr:DUF6482 family protein [Halomonas xinjiangensis]
MEESLPRTDRLENATVDQARELARHEPRPDVEMTSSRASVYLVYLHTPDTSYQLVNDDGSAVHLHSVEEVKDMLRPLGYTHGILTYMDASDEMVGNDDDGVSIDDVLKNGEHVGFNDRYHGP